MSAISALPESIVNALKAREELSGIVFLTEFPAVKKAVPLRHTTVSVGIENLQIRDAFTEEEAEDEYCRSADITLCLEIHAPFSLGGSECHRVFADVLDCLTFASDLEITASGCRSITADRDTDAFVLPAYISIRADFCPAESSSVRFPSFIAKNLLCASHISDGTIHHKSSCGTFFGNGASSRKFSLPFTPRFAVVFRANYAPVEEGCCFFAFAVTGSENPGLGLEDGGFRVYRDGEVNLNEAGEDYFYYAAG